LYNLQSFKNKHKRQNNIIPVVELHKLLPETAVPAIVESNLVMVGIPHHHHHHRGSIAALAPVSASLSEEATTSDSKEWCTGRHIMSLHLLMPLSASEIASLKEESIALKSKISALLNIPPGAGGWTSSSSLTQRDVICYLRGLDEAKDAHTKEELPEYKPLHHFHMQLFTLAKVSVVQVRSKHQRTARVCAPKVMGRGRQVRIRRICEERKMPRCSEGDRSAFCADWVQGICFAACLQTNVT
jgi:hypothetical protein